MMGNLKINDETDARMDNQFLTTYSRTTILKRKIYLVLALCVAAATAQAQIILEKPKELENIQVDEHLGAQLPESLVFTDEMGREVALKDYLHQGKPILLTLAYYRCPMLCGLVLNGVANSAKSLDLVAGKDYTILTVSIDPRETSELAAAKKNRYAESFPQAQNGWSFLVGKEENTQRLAMAVGFKYYYDKARDEYAHPAVSYLISPDGKITRYLYGIDYKRFDLKLGLMEAAEGKIGNTVDKLILSCFHYDPTTGKYVPLAMNIMRVAGALTLVALTVFLGVFWMRESAKHKRNRTVKADVELN